MTYRRPHFELDFPPNSPDNIDYERDLFDIEDLQEIANSFVEIFQINKRQDQLTSNDWRHILDSFCNARWNQTRILMEVELIRENTGRMQFGYELLVAFEIDGYDVNNVYGTLYDFKRKSDSGKYMCVRKLPVTASHSSNATAFSGPWIVDNVEKPLTMILLPRPLFGYDLHRTI